MILKGEDKLQMECCRILDLTKLLYFSIPNGANKESWFSKMLFKVTGLKAGVPDLMIAEPFDSNGIKSMLIKPHFNGCFLELKYKSNKQSDVQIEWQQALVKRGYAVLVIRSTKELIKVLQDCYPDKIKHIHF